MRFLFAGRLIWEKGVREFVEAARVIKKEYPRVQFQLLGFLNDSNPKSVDSNFLKKWQNEKVVKYLGETTDIRPYIQKANCLVFPSYYREGVSRVLMEAASMETPIITTDNVGCKEIVDHGKNGFVVPPQDIPALIDSLRDFIEMEDQDKMVMGKLGRKKMEKEYNEDVINQDYLGVIKNFLGPVNHIKSIPTNKKIIQN